MNYTFNDIAGYDFEKQELQRICNVLSNSEEYLSRGAKMPKGIIFYGASGSGKTLFTKVLASECGLHTYQIDMSNINSTTQICRSIRQAFRKASKHKGASMIFFDELDKVLPNADEDYCTDQSKIILAQLLTSIDGMKSSDKFIFVATCNDFDNLPDTLVRPGRIDKKICIGLPDYKSRLDILKFYSEKSLCEFESSPEEIAKLTSGFSGSGLETLVNECIIHSDENYFVSKNVINKAIIEIRRQDLPREGIPSLSNVIEACRFLGHFIVAHTFNNGDYILDLEDSNIGNNFFNRILYEFSDYWYDDDDDEDYDDDDEIEEDNYDEEENEKDCVGSSIINNIIDDENCFINISDENVYFNKEDFTNTICVLLGGFISEKIILQKTYDNTHDIFRTISFILLKMSALGMFGIENVYIQKRNERMFYSDDFTEHLDKIFDDHVAECYKKAEQIILKNEKLIRKMIPILVEKQSMNKSLCEQILSENGGIKQ